MSSGNKYSTIIVENAAMGIYCGGHLPKRYSAVIVETRPLENLAEIIGNHMKFLPSDWALTVFCSEANKHLVPVNAQVFMIPATFSINDYNRLLTSTWFWDSLDYDKVLIFQHDSEILRTGIEYYLQWDFVGAQDPRPGCEGMMNGGLSIRDVQAHREVLKHHQYDFLYAHNEDWWFCKRLKNLPMVIDPPFSVELEFMLGSFGAHAIDTWLTGKECKQIREQYWIENDVKHILK